MNPKIKTLKTQALIIGGGATGTGLARDLTLRGVECLLVEKKDLAAGASGGNHGLLHSGARYVESDPHSAIECREEGGILKHLAAHCIEDTGGYFTAVEGDDENYIADFPAMCEKCGISATPVEIEAAREAEPILSEKTIAVYEVPDASIDPFKLCLDNMAQAGRHGSTLMVDNRVTGFHITGNRITAVDLICDTSGEQTRVEAEQVVSASGAWAGIIADMVGARIRTLYSKGTLLVTQSRISKRVINRLRHPGNGDILVPGGTVSILGTTSMRTEHPDQCRPTIPEVDEIIEEGAAMAPILENTRYIRAYSGVRPLIQSDDDGDDRAVSRGFSLIDHAEDGIENLTTITGGKLTTYRLMAEKTADLVCAKMGISKKGETGERYLPSTDTGKWTEPGLAPKFWLSRHEKDDLILCECEMVSKEVADRIVAAIREQGGVPTLKAVGLRSRIGKGPCQGGFCSARIAAHMYDREILDGSRGVEELRAFINERWRGKRPILWDLPIEQAEIQEALHCGLYGLEL